MIGTILSQISHFAGAAQDQSIESDTLNQGVILVIAQRRQEAQVGPEQSQQFGMGAIWKDPVTWAVEVGMNL